MYKKPSDYFQEMEAGSNNLKVNQSLQKTERFFDKRQLIFFIPKSSDCFEDRCTISLALSEIKQSHYTPRNLSAARRHMRLSNIRW